MLKAGKQLIKENLVDIKSMIEEGSFEKALEVIVEYREFIALTIESKSVVDEFESIATTEIKAQAEATIRAQAEAEAKKQAEYEAELKKQAEYEARIRAEVEAEVRAEIKAQAEAEARKKLDAERKAKEQADIKARNEAKIEAETKARIRSEAEAKVRAEMKVEADTKPTMPKIEPKEDEKSDYSAFFEKLDDEQTRKAEKNKSFFAAAKEVGEKLIDGLSK